MKRLPPLFLSVLALLWAGVAAPAVASTHRHKPARPSQPLVLSPGFHQITGSGPVLTDGRYTYVVGHPYEVNAATPGSLIDEQPGRRTAVSTPAGCVSAAIGGGRLVFGCAGKPGAFLVIKLYSLSSGRLTNLPPAAQLERYDDGCASDSSPGCGVSLTGIGRAWIEFDETCYHCGDNYVFQNLRTGKVRRDPTSLTTVPDLNSSSLARKVCSPLQVVGSLEFLGPFAIARHAGTFLERCGTRLRERIDRVGTPLVTSNHLVVWQPPVLSELDGVLLPSLRRVVIKLPRRFTQNMYIHVVLSSRNLYVQTETDQVWEARIPEPSLRANS